MYERSAIVLERYLNNILGYFSENNLKVNFENYCSLVEKIDKFWHSYEQEQTAIQEFEDVTYRLKTIQKTQEKLYKKSAKLEFSRNILFNNIKDQTEDIESCMLKIENDVDKNTDALKNLRMEFISTLDEYNQKNSILVKSQKQKKESEKLYKQILDVSQENIDNINEFVLEMARNFNGGEIKEKLLKLMLDNGKEEKIPFDEEVIQLAADLGMDIAQKEVQCYIEAYDSILKLFLEIDKDEIKIEKFKRKLRNAKVILRFLAAQKEYLVQFLDYERMMSVNGKRTHKKLMEQACQNFRLDIAQINNLYELILAEIANKSTQKIYKELYNKSYLLEINREEESLKKEKNKVNSAVATVLGSNYWRIEGIKNIYTVFYKDVSETFGRDLDEFDLPEENDELEVEFFEESEEEEEFIPELQKQKNNIKVIEELEDDELPQLISEDELETEIVVKEVVKESKKSIFDLIEELEDDEEVEVPIIEKIKETRRDKVPTIEKLYEVEEDKIELIEESKEKYENKVEDKEEKKVEIIEKAKINDIEVAEEIKPKKRRRKDIIKEEEEKIKAEAKKKNEKVAIIEESEEEVDNGAEIIEEIKPKRRRKDIIKEEEEKIKAEAKKKKSEKIAIIEEIEENDSNDVEIIEEIKPKRRRKDIIKEEEEEKKKAKIKEVEKKKRKSKNQIIDETDELLSEEEFITKTQYFEEDKKSDIEDSSFENFDEDENEEEESLFGNIKNTRGLRNTSLDLEMLEQIEEKSKSSKKGIFSSLIKMNSKKGKRVAN